MIMPSLILLLIGCIMNNPFGNMMLGDPLYTLYINGILMYSREILHNV